jgi:hypothetical protein
MLKSVFRTIRNTLNQKATHDNDRHESGVRIGSESAGRTAWHKKSGVYPHWWLYRSPLEGLEEDKQETSNSDSMHLYVE